MYTRSRVGHQRNCAAAIMRHDPLGSAGSLARFFERAKLTCLSHIECD